MFKQQSFYDIQRSSKVTIKDQKIQLLIISRHLNDDLRSFLSNILKATKLEEKDIAIIDLDQSENSDFSFANIAEQNEIGHCIFIGDVLEKTGFNAILEKYSVVQFGRTSICLTDELASIQNNKQLKMALWQVLKNWFL